MCVYLCACVCVWCAQVCICLTCLKWSGCISIWICACMFWSACVHVCVCVCVRVCVCIGSCGDKPILIPWSPRASQGEDVDVELAVSAPESTAFLLHHTHTHIHTHKSTCTQTHTCTHIRTQCLFCKCEAPGGWISASYPVCDLSFNTTEPRLKNNQP